MAIVDELKRARTQRLIALENAYKTIEAFIIPSASPDILIKHEQVKKYLLEMYSEGINEGEKENYKFEI